MLGLMIKRSVQGEEGHGQPQEKGIKGQNIVIERVDMGNYKEAENLATTWNKKMSLSQDSEITLLSLAYVFV